MKLFMILTFSLCVLYIQVVHGIIINDIEVPNLITIDKDDSNETIKLDCDYELSNNDANLLVKWYKNNKLIYQWIRGRQPSVLPPLNKSIEIVKSSEDPNHEYRALTLTNIGIQLNGTYKCSVHAGTEFKSMEKDMNIVDMSDSKISFGERKVQNETHLECTVSNIFPKPIINIVSDNPTAIISKDKAKVILQENQHFDASQTVVASNSEGADNFDCYVSFEGLSLNISAREDVPSAEGDANNGGGALVVNAQIIVNSLFVILTLLMF